MDSNTIAIIKALILPPGINILIALIGFICYGFWRTIARILIACSFLLLIAFSLPAVMLPVIQQLEFYPHISPAAISAHPKKTAIVLLGAGRYAQAPEYKGDTISGPGLLRARYAAKLQKWSQLPILVTGGVLYSGGISEAKLMKTSLQEFGATDIWLEQHARNTADNAINSAKFLKKQGIDTVLVVTHAWHMPRAMLAFRATKLTAIPAPTGFTTETIKPSQILHWLPSLQALSWSRIVIHEVIGYLWYSMILGKQSAT